MSIERTPLRRRAVWLIAAGAVAVAGITGLSTMAASAEPVLPPLSPAELLTKVAQAHPDGLTATFEQRSDLGLPSLSGVGGSDGEDLQSALALLTGNHTVRVWLSGTNRSRVTLVDGSAETAAIRNGDQLWVWSSDKQQAKHATLKTGERPTTTPMSPTDAVQRLLAAVEPTTNVTTSGTGTVAGRPVYQLVLTPKDDASLVSQVRISVDSTTFVPLAARVVADDGTDALSVAATSVDFSRPADSIFAFTPPPGAEVSELKPPTGTSPEPKKDAVKPTIVGTGWTTVAVTKFDLGTADQTAKALLPSLPEVSGSWGTGRLLSTTLVNAVITDDGRIAVGSVAPEKLYSALAKR